MVKYAHAQHVCGGAGGSAVASDSIWHAVRGVRQAGKPIIVSMGTYAASGGYYISGVRRLWLSSLFVIQTAFCLLPRAQCSSYHHHHHSASSELVDLPGVHVCLMSVRLVKLAVQHNQPMVHVPLLHVFALGVLPAASSSRSWLAQVVIAGWVLLCRSKVAAQFVHTTQQTCHNDHNVPESLLIRYSNKAPSVCMTFVASTVLWIGCRLVLMREHMDKLC